MSSSMKNVAGYVGSTDLFKIDPHKIVIREGWNPRSSLDNLEDLKASIRDNGFYPDKPVLLYRRGTELELISGHRRLQAVRELIEEGVPIVAIPAVLDQSGDEGVRLARALAANQNGVPLEPLDEAQAFYTLTGYGWEPARIAKHIGRSLSYVYGRLKLLEATSDVLDAVERKEITQTDAVRIVEHANRAGVSQGEALIQTVEKRTAVKKARINPAASVPVEVLAQADERAMKCLLDEYGVAWVVGILLNYADKTEVLDAIHEYASVGV